MDSHCSTNYKDDKMKLSKLLLATIGATVLLGALVSSASARTFSISNQFSRTAFRAVTFGGAFGNITCPITFEGSLHSRIIPKVLGTLIGYITRADIGSCSFGRATILRETLPWHVRYLSFSGVLPNITQLRFNVIGFSLRIQEPFAGCLFRSEVGRPVIIAIERNTVTRELTTAELGGTLPSTCGISATVSSDRAPVTLLGTTTRITVTLI